MRQKLLAGRGQPHLPSTAVNQVKAQAAFEPLDPLTDRGLTNEQSLGGAAEMSFLGHRHEELELAKVHTSNGTGPDHE